MEAALQQYYLENCMTKECFTREIIALTDTMYGVSSTYLDSRDDCADAVQESILKAWARLHTLKREEYFRTWVIRILINECKNARKKQRPMLTLALIPEQSAPPHQDHELLDAVMALPEKYRVPLVLYHCEGYSVDEIASILHAPKGTVLSRLHRGREMLKRNSQTGEVCTHEG
jgi:RNA polymerase sigma-70 factor, ECF subfamily